MWLSNSSAESLTRPRLVVAVVSAVAAASAGYYAYTTYCSTSYSVPVESGLHRSNAIRRTRRTRRAGTASSSSSEGPVGDENEHAGAHTPQQLHDGATVVDDASEPWWDDPGLFPSSHRAGQNIVNLLFRVSEDNARRNGCVHRGCQCNSCGMVPIRGIRYRCANCADFDLCETCEAQGVHIKTHIFYKIKVPAPPFSPRQMQPVWYTGDPDTCPRTLPKRLIQKLSMHTGFERPELEAFWEHWTFMANAEWREDPDDLCVAMDRKTFERCLVPTGGSRNAAPNLIHDRMFHFYDTNGDDLIGFAEFLEGLSYRKRKDKLRKVFEGYDIDADGYVDRRDFLRMFRAYYVLYKQMHKDILDGLEDQLLSSTEAQQLVNSRQPLSGLFGRDSRVPGADAGVRFEGKTYHADGSVDVADEYHGAIVEDKGDTATREEILTSLFACDTETLAQRTFVTGSDADDNWRTVRRMSGNDPNRAYVVALLEPPQSLSELPEILSSSRVISADELTDFDPDSEDFTGAGIINELNIDDDGPMTDSARRAKIISLGRRQAPELEKRRRDMARRQLHERWKRRQFYLDEEEGGSAPEDWEEDEDILVNVDEEAGSSKSAEPPFATARSRSSSKVRFADDMDEYEVQSNPSTSSRSIPERWGGMEIPFAEKDAGREILYQVTQQAFNELLDTIFKRAEDLAIEAAETKALREKHKDLLGSVELGDDEEYTSAESSEDEEDNKPAKHIDERSLEELLRETGYRIASNEPRNAVEIDSRPGILASDETSDESDGSEAVTTEYRDPTLPQFRPNNDGGFDKAGPHRYATVNTPSPTTAAPAIGSTEQTPKAPEAAPTAEMLRRWKQLEVAEATAAERGGWGKLSFKEFEEIYKNQENEGNRLAYLGSWIDFCIP